MKRDQSKKEEIAEDFCFVCKDGGHLRVCDFKKCLKAYHPICVNKKDSFLEDDDRWICGSHSCSCGKSSSFQCFCCPTSYCYSCIKSAEFVNVKKKKGFCINCLRLSKMIEEDRHADSDGEEVDFNNTDTYEFLFKDYWEIVKDQEGLTMVDVQAADALLKSGENFQDDVYSDKQNDEEWMSEPDDLEDDCDDGKSLPKSVRGKQTMKTQMKKSKKGRTFVGWASEELVTFLETIGRSSTEPLSQVDVTEIVKDYVQSKNLFQPNKRRRNHVVPDDTLRSLFRKKKLKYHKIFDLVKSHLAEEQLDPSDDLSLSSDEDEETICAKKRRVTYSDFKTARSEPNNCRNKVLGQSASCYAAIITDNIKLIYLKKSLILELLKSPETFEDKVVGCFVRVKNDPRDFYYLVQKAYQLGQVSGIKKTGQTYKMGERSIDIVLHISNFSKDIKISMLSDDDFEEEECEDLRQLVKKGLFTQPTVAVLERKIRSVHEDIVNHWINREISKLQKQIDRANEKGWRRELDEYIDRRELLRKPVERMRLVKEIPTVIPDTSDTKANVDGQLNVDGVNKGDETIHIACDGNANAQETVAEKMPQGDETVAITNESNAEENDAENLPQGDETMGSESNTDSRKEVAEKMPQGNEAVGGEIAIDIVCTGTITDSSVKMPINLESEPKSKIGEYQATRIAESELESKIKNDEECSNNPQASQVQIIDLDLDDLEDVIMDVPREDNPTSTDVAPESQPRWHYRDPSGNEQGPFTLYSLWHWKQCGYFDDDFKVWESDQHEGDAILLAAALRPLFQKR